MFLYDPIMKNFVFLSFYKKVKGVWKSEVGSGKSKEKAKVIKFHQWEELIFYLTQVNI